MTTTIGGKFCALLMASSAMALPGAAMAQSAARPPAAGPSTSNQLQEVIVTAQRRSESLQKTALSITVLQPATIANAGVTNVNQLTTIVPGVQVGNSGPAPSVYLRGVGSYSSTAVTSPAVPFYIDGVYISRSQSVASEFYDVDRLEVLKGPQGTLYGRNASGGAINILTKQPLLDAYDVSGSAEVGNYSDYTMEAGVNIPIGDTVAIRASAQLVEKGGYTTEGFGDDKHQAGRIKLLWRPDGKLSFLVNLSAGHIGGQGPGVVLLNRIPGQSAWLDGTSPQAQQLIQSTSTVPPGALRPSEPSDAYQNLTFLNASGQMDWDLGFAMLTVVPAYRSAHMAYNGLVTFDYDDGGGFPGFGPRPETSEAESLEARLSRNIGRLKIVGGFYTDNEDQFQQYTLNAGVIQHLGVIADYHTRSYAGFGQATYSLFDHFRLIGGLRYTADRKQIDNGQYYGISPSILPTCNPPQPTCLTETFDGDKTFYNLSWKGGFEADVLNDSLFYATASRGFKAGGFNTQRADPSSPQALPFQPELLTSYDVGLKNRFLNNRLQVNVSGFFWDYKNHQEPKVSITPDGNANLIYYNAGDAHIYGGDVDVIARPWAGGTANLSVEYTKSKYESFSYTQSAAFVGATGCKQTPNGQFGAFGPIVTVDCAGFQVARTPEWSGNVGFTQEFSLGERGKLIANTTTNFAASRWLSVEFTPIERAGAYALVDAALTYQPTRAAWSVTAFVRNINNGKDYTFATPSPYSSGVVAAIDAPRTYGARINFEFR